MPQKTNLNVAPYFDDFDSTDNFQHLLFRPGFAVQARELTQLQTLLKNQMEHQGRHLFKEGAMIIPGRISLDKNFQFVKLENSFSSENIDITQYLNAETPVTITGVTTGVKAKVHLVVAATTVDPPVLYVQYTAAGTDNTTLVFANGENLSADVGITHTTSYSSGVASATTASTSATGSGTGSNIQAGVYYIRGQFVEVAEETIVLSKFDINFSGRVGLTITESLITPEVDSSLTDNSQGSSNFAAKGAHRLKISCALATLAETSTADENFVELMRVKNSVALSQIRETEFGTIEDTFARRTFDESGDYTVRPFQFELKECVTVNENEGVFVADATTDDGNTASSSLLSLKVSPGKAYVKGYELEKIAPTFKDINKARDFNTVNAGITSFDVGNFVNINNVYGSPDISAVTNEATAYKQISLFDTATVTRGSSAGTRIGVGRARTMEFSSGTVGLAETIYKLFLFDIRPFTFLTLSGTPSATLVANHSDGGVQVTGATSGATGFVFGDGTSGTLVILTNVAGTFVSGEKIKASDSSETDLIVENSGNTDLTITSIKLSSFSEVRQVFMSDDDTGQNFSADIALSTLNTDASFLLLDGTDSASSDAEDNLRLEDGTTTTTSNGDNSALELGAAGGTGSSKLVAKLQEAEKNISLFKAIKKTVKTHLTTTNSGVSDTQFQVRRQYVVSGSAIGVVTISGETGETFLSHSEANYTMTILTAGGAGSGQQGDVVSCSTGFSGGGTSTVTITNQGVLGNGAKVKILATLLKTGVTAKSKTTTLMKQVKVATGATDAFGTRPTDKTISLGRADSFKLVGVYDSEDTSSDAAAPTLTLSASTGVFTKGELITGSSSGAKGRIINTSSPISFVQSGIKVFTTSDTITGSSSGATGTVSAVTEGSIVITNRYLLDTGQRDNFYDISRIVRKSGSEKPLGRLLILHDYMEHGAGECFTVDSYVDVADQMDFEDIPTYTATKVDPDAPAPTGEYPLYDTYDFRPRVEDIAGTNSSADVVDEITGNSFDFFHRQFDGTGSSTTNFPNPGANIQSDFEYFLPKWVLVHINKEGEFVITEGESDEQPVVPKEPDGMMKLGTLYLPAFTFKPQEVSVRRQKNQRYTMKDIGRLEDRIDNVEYYTALSLLERDAESFEIQDSNGLNRFKSGFVVDNFAGHKIGDTQHVDYKNSIDFEKKELRAPHQMKGISLIESVTTDAARAGVGYQKTGDLITLPYTSVTSTDQPYATRLERITPVLLSNWQGTITLTPSSDEWFETEVAPDLIINVEGNFDTFFEANRSQIGTVWNAWQTQWSGVVSTVVQNNPGGGRRSVTTTRTDLARTGIRTDIVEKIDLESQGTRVISRAVIPYIRSKNVKFVGEGFYPNTQVFAFFDKIAVSEFCTPDAGFSTNDESIVQGSAMVTTATGKMSGTFIIPDPKVAENTQWQSGELQFRLTSSSTNVTSIDPVTAGQAIYYAKGILETEQESILAIRNAEIRTDSVNETTSRSSSSVRVTPRPRQDIIPEPDASPDPLAQTFFVEEIAEDGEDGAFLTSVDLFHGEKDDSIPVTVEIRNVVNGYPGPKVLPFGRITKDVADINTSENAATATTYTFPSPVYVQSGHEYCICIITGVPTHKVFIARMGETDIGGTRTVSKQPHTGVLFKGHNNRTWAPSLTEDLKYVLRKAKFTTGTNGVVTLKNDEVPTKTLAANPLIFTNSSTTLRIKHPNHHMYSTSNNVTISGVVSGATTTLNGAITAAATTLTLTLGTNFDDTSGKFSQDASSEWYIKIDDEILKYNAISTNAVSGITRAQDGTTAASHADGATVELYMLHKIPFTEINKTHTAIANIGLDYYTITLTGTPTISGGSDTAENGGTSVVVTENAIYNTGMAMISTMKMNNTDVKAQIQPTTGTSPSGTETSFSTTIIADATSIPIGENVYFDATQIVCSSINETNELSGSASLQIPLTLSSSRANLSPVIDTERASWIAVANRLDNIDSSSDVFPTTDFVPTTDPEGDNNAAIYMTKKVTLETPATALRVFFAGYRHSSAEIKVLFKTLRTDDASDFDDLGWTYFNTTGTTDTPTNSSLTVDDFQQYEYTAGVKDDGTETALDEFISFSIKIVMQGTNSSEPPRIKDLRCIALAT